ncbi:toll/interleukin-1 receptor domain-containing protein [Frankia sp. CiP1_Cm_nod1]
MPGYRFDVFLSYRRAGTVLPWVHNHFHRMLVRCLTDELDRKPEIFIDVDQIHAGERWPDALAQAHSRSRLLVAVWTPSYFGSRWCVAEWRSMQRREALLGLSTAPDTHRLVYPIRLKDGDRFPHDAKRTQQRDMKDWNVSSTSFEQTPAYAGFERKVAEIAEELVARLDVVPDWRPDLPVLRPEPEPPHRAAVPRL